MSAITVIINGVQYRPCAPDVAPEVGIGPTFSGLMRAHRKSFGWTLDEAAEKIGCAKSYLWGIESGKHEPSLRMGYAIMKAYDLSMIRQAIAMISWTDAAAPVPAPKQ